MRDAKRIEPFLEKFGELWHLMPDMRFTQLVSYMNNKFQAGFHTEEEDLFKQMDAYIKSIYQEKFNEKMDEVLERK